jgi:hypothetical protein
MAFSIDGTTIPLMEFETRRPNGDEHSFIISLMRQTRQGHWIGALRRSHHRIDGIPSIAMD